MPISKVALECFIALFSGLTLTRLSALRRMKVGDSLRDRRMYSPSATITTLLKNGTRHSPLSMTSSLPLTTRKYTTAARMVPSWMPRNGKAA